MTWIHAGDAAHRVVNRIKLIHELRRSAELSESPRDRMALTSAADIIEAQQAELSELRRQLNVSIERQAEDREWAAI